MGGFEVFSFAETRKLVLASQKLTSFVFRQALCWERDRLARRQALRLHPKFELAVTANAGKLLALPGLSLNEMPV